MCTETEYNITFHLYVGYFNADVMIYKSKLNILCKVERKKYSIRIFNN